ncbi:MAG: hypothetical protein EOP41_05075 [Sphingobacteriaceae bacterium]|nr:MAG: hypothetical protein EOP41_05075 [Sphingobacteriaceae bacterium]
MFIIWRGYGFLVPIITIVTGALVTVLFHIVSKSSEPWGISVGSFVAAAIIWFWGKKLNDPAKNKILVDKATGQELILKPNHSLFFIKMQYWAFVIGGLGMVTFISLIMKR